MSALLRQALLLLDSEGQVGARKPRNVTRQGLPPKQTERKHPYKRAGKKGRAADKTPAQKVEENLRKLQCLSTQTVDKSITDQIVERAVKGRPLADKIDVPKEDHTPVLFTEETFKQFEKEYFCS